MEIYRDITDKTVMGDEINIANISRILMSILRGEN